MTARLDFWFDFASSYSYLAAARIGPLADAAGIAVTWRPFLLGPVFAGLGFSAPPFAVQKTKGSYMWRDLQRLGEKHGLPFTRPTLFPPRSLLAARAAIALRHAGGPVAAFGVEVFKAAYGRGEDIGDEGLVASLLERAGADAASTLAAARTEAVKLELRTETERAQALNLFGAPSFVTEDGELFWGHDRMEDALDWARNPARRVPAPNAPAAA